MSELKAAPGPWVARDNKVYVGKRLVCGVHAGAELNIAAMVSRRNANAALIAEAPAMYEEIKYHLEMTRLMPDGEQTADFKRMDALLKKARGEA